MPAANPKPVIVILLLMLSLLPLCTDMGSSTYEDLAAENLPATVTYTDHVSVIVDEHCLLCHSNDGGNSEEGISYDTYTETVDGFSGFIETVNDQSMPPGSWERMTDRQKAVLLKWEEQGFQK